MTTEFKSGLLPNLFCLICIIGRFNIAYISSTINTSPSPNHTPHLFSHPLTCFPAQYLAHYRCKIGTGSAVLSGQPAWYPAGAGCLDYFFPGGHTVHCPQLPDQYYAIIYLWLSTNFFIGSTLNNFC